MAITANGTVRSLAHRVLDQLDTFPAIGFHLPASFQNLDRIQELLEAPLDPQFRELISLGDGETEKSPGVFYGMRVLGTEEIIALLESGKHWVGWLPFAQDTEQRLLGVLQAENPDEAGTVTARLSASAAPVEVANNIADLLAAVLASLELREGYPEVLRIRTNDAWLAPYVFGLNAGNNTPVPFLSVINQISLPLGSGGTHGAVVDHNNPLGTNYVAPISAYDHANERPIGEAQFSTDQRPIGEGISGGTTPIGEEKADLRTATTAAVGVAAAAGAAAIGAAAAAGAAAVTETAQAAVTSQAGTASEAVVPDPAPAIPAMPLVADTNAIISDEIPNSVGNAAEAEATVEAMSLPTADLGALEMLRRVPGLRSLELPDLTPILDNLETLGGLTGLRKLSVQSAYQPVLDQLRKLKNLEELTVKNSMFYALNYLKSFPKLEKLEFVNTTIQNASVLGELKNLRSLHLENTFIENGFDAILKNHSITDFVGDAEQTRIFNEYRARRG